VLNKKAGKSNLAGGVKGILGESREKCQSGVSQTCWLALASTDWRCKTSGSRDALVEVSVHSVIGTVAKGPHRARRASVRVA
jgi:hypothetical protein